MQISDIISSNYPEYSSHFSEVAQKVIKTILDTLKDKVSKITEGFKKQKNLDQARKELKLLESQVIFEDSAINQISNKFTTFINKTKEKKLEIQPSPPQPKSIKIQCEERFKQKFQKEVNFKAELPKCFYYYHLV